MPTIYIPPRPSLQLMAMSTTRAFNGRVQSDDADVRIEDYLNDKLQTYTDLENLDSLLKNVRNQQDLLRDQLQEAEDALDKAVQASKVHSANLGSEVEKFQKKQADIDRRLLIVTHSETSDDAVQKFNESMEKLKRLDVAKGYVESLKEVDRLSAEIRTNIQTSPDTGLSPYVSLRSIADALEQAQPAAEDAAPHLIDHVQKMASSMRTQIRDIFATELEKSLLKIKWPNKDARLMGITEQEWGTGVERLLKLQEPYDQVLPKPLPFPKSILNTMRRELLVQESRSDSSGSQEEPLVLLPLEVMVRPLELRFIYHFEGDRPTNKLDKPEYFLSHIINLLNTYDEFFFLYLQPVLQRQFKGTNLALNTAYINSTSALITSLLPMLRRKIFAVLPQIQKLPQLLSHLMHELMSFDNSLRDDWGYDAGFGVDGWKGLTWEVLVKKDWFGKWLQVEKDFALSRYQNIIDTPDSGEIDYDSVDPGVTKSTKAAVRVNDLLETVTDRYRPLNSFHQKLRFLIDIQIAIFDKLHDRLHSSLEAYLTPTSSIARTVQGVSKEEQAQLHGLGGLERLCRVYGSAEYLEKKMRDWSDDVFFLELWDELQYRAKSNSTGGNKQLSGGMTMEHIASRTSSNIISEDSAAGALFDETASAYRRLRVRSEAIMQELLNTSMRDSLRPYSRITPWSSLSTDITNPTNLAITAELDAPLQLLSINLAFLSKCLAEAALRRIVRQLTLSIQIYLWDHVLMRHSFSSYGAAQLSRDVTAIWEVVDRYLGPGQGEAGMRKLREGLTLLSMPIKSKKNGTVDGAEDDEVDIDAWIGEDGGGIDGEQEPDMGVWEVEKRMFRSNESAREVLEELGMETLMESEARGVLERRIELGN